MDTATIIIGLDYDVLNATLLHLTTLLELSDMLPIVCGDMNAMEMLCRCPPNGSSHGNGKHTPASPYARYQKTTLERRFHHRS